jgi:4-amino-4-deoxy-L-arabinose transferase-like glycosyltransferase
MLARLIDRLADTRRQRLWLSLLCALLWLPGLFHLPPTDREEARFAVATLRLIEAGEVPQGTRSPLAAHAPQAAVVLAAEAVGLPGRAMIGAYRLPSLLAAWVAVLLLFALGRSVVGRRAAFLAAALLASALVIGVEARLAKADALLLAAAVATMGLLGRAYLAPAGFGRWQAAALWCAVGLGMLAMGALLPLLLALTFVSLAAMDRGAPWLPALRPVPGVVLALLVASPVLLAGPPGGWLAGGALGDILGAAGSAAERHPGPPGFHAALFGIVAFPAAVFVLRALPQAWAARTQPATRLLLAWAVPAWLLAEASATKLPHHILPALPALCLLAAAWARDPLRREPGRLIRALSLAALWGPAIGLGLAAAVLPRLADRALDPVSLLALPAGLLLAWSVQRAIAAGRPARAALLAVLLAAPLQATVLATLARMEAPWIAPRLAAAAAPGALGSSGFREPSLVIATGGGARLLDGWRDALAFLAEAPTRRVAIEARDEDAFRAAAAEAGLALRPLGQVEGFNPARGRFVVVLLFARE